jgi:hypothetical protein
VIPIAAVRSARRASAHGGEDGETLVELLVAVIVMGTAVVAVVTSLLSAAIASQTARQLVASGNQATTVAELIQNASYSDCISQNNPYVASYSSPHYTLPTGYTMKVTAAYLHSQTSTTPTFDPTCPSVDQGLQQITVKVRHSAAGGSHRWVTVTIVKRKPA